MLLKKGVKSLQSTLNEWVIDSDENVSASALSQARHKFKHTAFIELLEKAVIYVMYNVGSYERFKGRRLLALDCSSLRLPKTAETKGRFGEVFHKDKKGRVCGSQVEAKMTVLYDALNDVPISAQLCPGRMNDLKACEGQYCYLQPEDIVIADRGYVSYRFFAKIVSRRADFVVRAKSWCFKKYYNRLVNDRDCKEVIGTIRPGKKGSEDSLFPDELKVRFIKVILSTGEIEVLVTSLLDRDKFTVKSFKKLYYKRWKVETFFHTLKSRLSIDNFSGKSVESIYQDFHSTIFISGLETILRGEVDDELKSKKTKYRYKVNKAVSFNIIKNKVLQILFEHPPDFYGQIKEAFSLNPVSVRPNRIKKRVKADNSVKSRASAYFQKCARKHVF